MKNKKNIIITIVMIILIAITCVALSGCVKVDEAEIQRREAAKETLKAEKNRQREAQAAEQRRQETVHFTIDSLGGTVLDKNYAYPTLIVYATNQKEQRQEALIVYFSYSMVDDIRNACILEVTAQEFEPGMTIAVHQSNIYARPDNNPYSVKGGKLTIQCINPEDITICPPQDGSMTSSLEIPESMDAKNILP